VSNTNKVIYRRLESHLSSQNSWMCTKQSIKEETENENPCSHNILVFHIAKTSFWEVKEIRIRDKSMPIRQHYCTLLYLSIECVYVYVSSGVNRSFSTTWLTISTARCGMTGYYGRSMLDWRPDSKLWPAHVVWRWGRPLNEQQNRI